MDHNNRVAIMDKERDRVKDSREALENAYKKLDDMQDVASFALVDHRMAKHCIRVAYVALEEAESSLKKAIDAEREDQLLAPTKSPPESSGGAPAKKGKHHG